MDGALPERVYTVLCPFGGIGAGALGFLQAETRLFGVRARFRCVGSLDLDALACEGFRYLTGAPAWVCDIAKLPPVQLLAWVGEEAPDVVFMSPPCKSFSKLTNKKARQSAKYKAMSRLVLDWVRTMLAAWSKRPPRLVLLENVPGIATLGKELLAEVRRLLRAAGYVVSPGESHDCGELGGLAQHRQRYLLVARHQPQVSALLYQPRKLPLKTIGEVLGPLPLPGDEAAGPLHTIPRISLLNWWRLSLIPPGGDWRDIPGTVPEGKTRNEVFRRYRTVAWAEVSPTITGVGANAVEYVGDPRLDLGPSAHTNLYMMAPWGEPARTVTGGTRPGGGALSGADPRVESQRFGMNMRVAAWAMPSWTITGATDVQAGAPSVADARLGADNPNRHEMKFAVQGWDAPARTVTGTDTRVGSGAPCAADPRVPSAFKAGYGVNGWDESIGTVIGESYVPNGAFSVADPRIASARRGRWGVGGWDGASTTVTGNARSTTGTFSVADPRVPTAYDRCYGVMPWDVVSNTVAGSSDVGCGAYAVADPRLTCKVRNGFYGVLDWGEPAWTITGSLQIDNGPAAVSDPRVPGSPALRVRYFARNLKSRPPFALVLPTEDGTWHRPLTTLELAVLQGLPTHVDGKPLRLRGSSAKVREHIGNAVPVGSARAIAEQMLQTLVGSDVERWALGGGGGDVWVDGPAREAVLQ